MTEFGCEWLRMREPADAASRAPTIAQTLNRVLIDRPVQIIDLATGTGANLRYLSPRIGGRQEWWLIDRDPTLLGAIPASIQAWAAHNEASVRHSRDALRIIGPGFDCLAHSVRRDLATELGAIELPAGALVSGSALLDLVSEEWIRTLARRCLSARAHALFALTYDGRMSFEPSEQEDERVRELVNRHQTTDKGFGHALGPAAGETAMRVFGEIGYRVQAERSDWHIGPSAGDLQNALLDTWVTVAVEIAPEQTAALQDWAERRRAHVNAHRSKLSVGHIDLIGWLPQ